MRDIPDYAIYNLATAVISRAAVDYHNALKKGDSALGSKIELERFFNGKFFALATDNYPLDLFMERIERGDCYRITKKENRRNGQLKRTDRKPRKAKLSV